MYKFIFFQEYNLDCRQKHEYDIDIYLLTAIGLTPGGSSTVHIYTQTIQQLNTINNFVWKGFWNSKPEWSK